MAFTRDELRGLIEDPRTFRGLEPVIHRSDNIDYAEVGGEVYLTADEQALRFRIIPSEYEKFAKLLDELKQGRYVRGHFERLLQFAEKETRCIANGSGWKSVTRRMRWFQNDGKDPKKAKEIESAYRGLLECLYKKPDKVGRLSVESEYVCDFHVHGLAQEISNVDKRGAEKEPEIILFYDKNHNMRGSDPPLRQVILAYIFPGRGSGLGFPNYRSQQHIFGSYGIESVGKRIRAFA